MNAIYILGFVCLVALSVSGSDPGSAPSDGADKDGAKEGKHHHHGGNYGGGKHGHHSKSDIDWAACFNNEKFYGKAATTPGCEDLKPTDESTATDNKEKSKEEKKKAMIHVMECYSKIYETVNDAGDTVVANVEKGITDSAATSDIATKLIEAYRKCAGEGKEQLPSEEAVKAFGCYMKAMGKACPKKTEDAQPETTA